MPRYERPPREDVGVVVADCDMPSTSGFIPSTLEETVMVIVVMVELVILID